MPLLRYRLDDSVAPLAAGCPCGLGFARIAAPLGRENELVRLPSGRTLSPLGFGTRLEDLEGVRQWRVKQTTVDRLVLQLRFASPPPPALLESGRRRVLEHLGEPLRVDVELCDFAVERARKFRVFVSEIGTPSRPAG